MTDPSPNRDESEESNPADDPFDEIRAAAGAVVVSLRQLLEAAERVVEDPAAFDSVISTGKSVVEAFTTGFMDDGRDAATADDSEE